MNDRHTSTTDDWQTPDYILEPARKLLGEIDLDPATSKQANERVRAKHYFDELDNGFLAEWGPLNGNPSRVFINPPGGKCDEEGNRIVGHRAHLTAPIVYKRADGGPPVGKSQSAAKVWWFRLAREFMEGRVERAIFLAFSIELLQTAQAGTPPKTSAGVFLPIPTDFPICIPSRRISFIDPSGNPVRGNTHASAIIYVVPHGRRDNAGGKFREAFADVGRCINV